jgi:hypothetical protein
MFNLKAAIAISVLSLAASVGAHAAGGKPDLIIPGNYWKVTAYNDASTVHAQLATQGLCFFQTAVIGTQTAGIWYSPTFFDWNGTWRQEGDQIFMTGDFAGDYLGSAVGHDGMEWQIVTVDKNNEGFGHWHEWLENGAYGSVIGYANAKFTRIGRCPYQPPTGTVGLALEKLVNEVSLKAPRRVRTDGKEALGPNDGFQVPVELPPPAK